MPVYSRYQLEQIEFKLIQLLERLDSKLTPSYDEWNEIVKDINLKAGRKYAESLGLKPNAKLEAMIRVQFNEKIIQIINEKKLLLKDVAISIKGSRSKVSRVVNRKLKGITTDFLIRMLSGLGVEIQIIFK
jgi:predicted XRE-type DNA-binding protein